jgi:hypothetical protein
MQEQKRLRLAGCCFDALDSVVFSVLVDYLPIISVMALVRAYPPIRAKLGVSVYALVWARVAAYVHLISSKTALTGGTLLQLITSDTWNPDDIDLATVEDPGPPCTKSFGNTTYSSPNLIDVYQIQDTKIQYLHVRTILGYVRSFDLSVCRNLLDADRLVICCPFAVLRRQSHVDVDKYYSVKFQTPEHVMHNFLPARYLRLEKYIKRGFNLILTRSYTDSRELRHKIYGHGGHHTSKQICNAWIGFWNQCLSPDGKLLGYPAWKNAGIPTMYFQNT